MGGRSIIMPICFTHPLQNDSENIYATLPLLQRRTPLPLGLNVGTYNIRGGHGLGLPHSIHAVQLGNYDLILLMEMNIVDAV